MTATYASPRKHRKKKVVYIATIEKANSLTNSLIELQRISDLGLVVIDEVSAEWLRVVAGDVMAVCVYLKLHMLGDKSVRGATLEACIAKLKFCAGV